MMNVGSVLVQAIDRDPRQHAPAVHRDRRTAAECHVLTHVAPGYAEIQRCTDLRRETKIWCDHMQDRITAARRDR